MNFGIASVDPADIRVVQVAAADLGIGVAPIELIGMELSTGSLVSARDLTIRSGNIDSIVYCLPK